MSEAQGGLRAGSNYDRGFPRRLGIFEPWRLCAYGCAITTVYVALYLGLYRSGAWLVNSGGTPVYTDFTRFWFAGLQALRGEIPSVYDPIEFMRVQDMLVGTGHSVFSNWPYPPTFFLILAPLATLPYVAAFLTSGVVTLLGCIVVVYFIVRQPPAIALVLASPFTVWNLTGGQNGLLTASLLGASLLLLERRPVLAGLFIGCLSYKPQFGILLPVALAASNQWRAFASATATTVLLVGASIAAFGAGAWLAFPRELLAQNSAILLFDSDKAPIPNLGLQTIYGLIRALHLGAPMAWLAQGAAAAGIVVIVWLVWRSPVRYSLKAATLSAAILLATPYAYAYDMAVTAISLAFLATDQLSRGLLRGEQTTMIALFAASVVILVSFGSAPLGPVVMMTLLVLVLRRDWSWWEARHTALIRRKFFETICLVSD
jgi:arabinofuranan 3-O-arabinosyltransferase